MTLVSFSLCFLTFLYFFDCFGVGLRMLCMGVCCQTIFFIFQMFQMLFFLSKFPYISKSKMNQIQGISIAQKSGAKHRFLNLYSTSKTVFIFPCYFYHSCKWYRNFITKSRFAAFLYYDKPIYSSPTKYILLRNIFPHCFLTTQNKSCSVIPFF